MTEIQPAGYRWVRARVYERWRYLAIFGIDGHELCRLDTQTDPRCARTINDATGEVEITASLMGSDPEFASILPVRIVASALVPEPSNGEIRTRVQYTNITFATAVDGVTLPHVVHIPVSLLEEVI